VVSFMWGRLSGRDGDHIPDAPEADLQPLRLRFVQHGDISMQAVRGSNNGVCIRDKKQENLVTEFDEELWYITVDRVEVHADGRLSIVFRDYVAVDMRA